MATVDRATLIELLGQVLSRTLDDKLIQNDTKLSEDLNMDSLSLVSLMFLCEEKFKIDIVNNADKVRNIATFGDIISFFVNNEEASVAV